uniref:lipocalin-like domain-containing protein n=1 Tax=Shewanella sp. TaxID=50422 RepID=UPI003561D273
MGGRFPHIVALLLTLLWGCACSEVSTTEPVSATSTGMGELMAGDIEGFDKVSPHTRLSFPADHGPHNNFRQEWWYLTANLTTAAGEPLGLQWTQFRVALKPQTAVEQTADDWQSPQL